MPNEKYVNPFKTGKLKNPGVSVQASREKLKQKLKKVRGK